MLYTIVDINDVFFENSIINRQGRSSNPFDYIRTGYYLDNAELFGGYNNVNFNCNHSGNITSGDMGAPH